MKVPMTERKSLNELYLNLPSSSNTEYLNTECSTTMCSNYIVLQYATQKIPHNHSPITIDPTRSASTYYWFYYTISIPPTSSILYREFICMHLLVKYLNRISARNFSFPESIFGTAWGGNLRRFRFFYPELLLSAI